MTASVTFRAGEWRDGADLALLMDAASRRIMAFLWSREAGPGQSWFEFGRNRILTESSRASYHANWWVAEQDGQRVGAFFGFRLPDPPEDEDLSQWPEVVHPLIWLDTQAPGAWLLQVIALYPEWRGSGLAPLLLQRACQEARASGATRIVLQVESSNPRAMSAYGKFGFGELLRCPYVGFPGSDDNGDWVLMGMDL